MTEPERVLFVHAHPDDETIATGGTLATLVDRGAVVTLVTCTRGERGEVIPADLQSALASPEAMAELREGELRRAVGILGVTDHRFLGDANARWGDRTPRRYVDSGMRWGAAGAEASGEYDPASLTSADFGDVAADIAAVLLAVQPHAIVSYNEWGGYGHPDHIRAHQAARRAAEVYGVPFFAVEPDESSAQTPIRVDVSAVFDRKRAALEAYRSQATVSGDDFALSNGVSHPIDRVERFRQIAVDEDGPAQFSEQSWSGRIALSAIGAIVGGAAAALVTVFNQTTAKVFGIEVWSGTIIGIALIAALLVGFRLAFGTRVVAFWAAAAMVVVVGLFSVQSAGGTVLIPLTPSGIVWAVAPLLVGLLVLLWPIGRRRPIRIRGQQTGVKGPQQP
jgi:N-acetyl-1-D-myo-inositol-2-amino-2-deoxy-alpha-D-glucopyranoside deacetylase